MCTAMTYLAEHTFFGRTLDLECTLGEQLTVTPQAFPLKFRYLPTISRHYGILGIAHVAEGYPLYYDAVNEKGLAMAGLNFPQSTCYSKLLPGKQGIAPFEVIPWVLGQCATVAQAKELLRQRVIIQEDFSPQLPATPLHWMVADAAGACMVVEALAEGIALYDNPAGVLTNEPDFCWQMTHLSLYRQLCARAGEDSFAPTLQLPALSRGMGSFGLPGEYTSPARFVRAAFVRGNALCPEQCSTQELAAHFFALMASVQQPFGSVVLADDQAVYTVYTACADLTEKAYYYKPYFSLTPRYISLESTAYGGDTLQQISN